MVMQRAKKTQKFVFRSALRPNQISFSHDQDPLLTLGGLSFRSATAPDLILLNPLRSRNPSPRQRMPPVAQWRHSMICAIGEGLVREQEHRAIHGRRVDVIERDGSGPALRGERQHGVAMSILTDMDVRHLVYVCAPGKINAIAFREVEVGDFVTAGCVMAR